MYKAIYRNPEDYLDLNPGEYTVKDDYVYFKLPDEMVPSQWSKSKLLYVDEHSGWKIHSVNPITVTPSIFINMNYPHFGQWHGYLTNGEFVSC